MSYQGDINRCCVYSSAAEGGGRGAASGLWLEYMGDTRARYRVRPRVMCFFVHEVRISSPVRVRFR